MDNVIDSKCLVSVVIPTVIVNNYLQEAVESILKQSYEKVEVIVVLDGAQLPNPLPTYLEDPRVRLVKHEQNQGTPKALNSGIKAADGKLIARLDADDIALEGRIQAQVDYFLQNPSTVCVGTGSLLIDSVGKIVAGSESQNSGGIVTHKLLVRNPLLHSSVMYRTDSVRAIGGYSLVMRRMQDYELYLRLAREGEISVLPRILSAYRVHDNQHSKNTSPWTPYTRLILRRRLELAKFQGASLIKQKCRNIVWFLGQIVRHYGFVQPGYLRKLHK